MDLLKKHLESIQESTNSSYGISEAKDTEYKKVKKYLDGKKIKYKEVSGFGGKSKGFKFNHNGYEVTITLQMLGFEPEMQLSQLVVDSLDDDGKGEFERYDYIKIKKSSDRLKDLKSKIDKL